MRQWCAICATLAMCVGGAPACSPPTPPARRIVLEPPRRIEPEPERDRADEEEETDGPGEALEWRRLRWFDEHGGLAPDALRIAVAQRDENLAYWAAHTGDPPEGVNPTSWIERGPDNVGGRTRALVIHPDNPDRMWAGAVGGGIWSTTDAGDTWQSVSDELPSLAICALAIDPSNPAVMYAGTGEGYFNGDALGGAGIYRSSDGGDTWSQLSSTASWDNVCRVAVSPANDTVLLAAKRYGGILRSTTAGHSWTTVLAAQGSYQVAFDPTDGAKAVAHVLDYDFALNQWFHGAAYSTDGGASWSSAAGLNQVVGFGARIELAYSRSQPATVYASVATDGGRIWRSTDGGHSYSLRTTSGSSGANWFANPLWVDPTNPNIVVTGGYSLWRSLDAGATLTQISDGYIMTSQPHPDIHFITNDPGYDGMTNRRVYVCTDGGVWRTDDVHAASASAGWTRRDQGYRVTQFYSAAGDGPTALIIGGTQDNGTLRLSGATQQASLMFGGDGGFCAIDPSNPNYCYGEYVRLQIHRSTNAGVTSGYIYNGIADAGNNANFIAPFMLDPNNAATMLAGGASLWRSTNVKSPVPSWQAIRPPGGDKISAIAVTPGNSNVIWVGQNNGEVQRTSNGTAASPAWSTIDNNAGLNPLPNRYVERILVDPAAGSTVYVCLGGFSGDNLWKTVNNGVTWLDISGNGATGLPAAPINALARHPLHPERLYVGTEVGIFTTADGGLTWATTNQGPANVAIDELVFMNNSTTLLAATHGRGLFTAELCPPADYDCNGRIDLADHAALAICLSIPGATPAPLPPLSSAACRTAFDFDADGDVDLRDCASFLGAFTGP